MFLPFFCNQQFLQRAEKCQKIKKSGFFDIRHIILVFFHNRHFLFVWCANTLRTSIIIKKWFLHIFYCIKYHIQKFDPNSDVRNRVNVYPTRSKWYSNAMKYLFFVVKCLFIVVKCIMWAIKCIVVILIKFSYFSFQLDRKV